MLTQETKEPSTSKIALLRVRFRKESLEHEELKLQFSKQQIEYERRHFVANEVIKRQADTYQLKIDELDSQMDAARFEFQRRYALLESGRESNGCGIETCSDDICTKEKIRIDAEQMELDYNELKLRHGEV